MAKPMSLRRSVAGERKKKGGKGWKGSWRDRFNVPKSDATYILLCPGDYPDERPDSIKEAGGEITSKPYHVHPNHVIKDKNLFRKLRCACDWDGSGECICCYRKNAGDRRIGPAREVYSLNMLHFDLYHKTPRLDKKNKPMRFESDDPNGNFKRGDKILSWQQITRARDRKEALENLEEGLEDKTLAMFRKKYIEVGSSHLQNLMVIDDMARSHCVCSGALEPVAFFCEKCDEELCNVEEANMTGEERDAYALDRQRCDGCGHFGFPELEYICDECGEPEPLTAFDVVAKIRKTGEQTASTIIIEEVIPVNKFDLPDGYGIIQLDDDDEVIEDKDGNLLYEDDIAKMRDNQFNFDKVHQPLNNDDTAKLLNCDNPFESRGGSAQRYARSGGRFKGGDNGNDGDDNDGEEESKPRRRSRRSSRRRPAK